MSFELLFLGTGTSAGVPMIACDCAVCTSEDPRDHRTRSSVLISYGHDPVHAGPYRWLVDTTPELRLQIVRHRIRHIHGVLYTHAHSDHIVGIDDLRRFNAVTHSHMDIYADARTLGILRDMFKYIFQPNNNINQSFVPTLQPRELRAGEPMQLANATWTPVPLMHGKLPVLGFRVDFAGQSLAYCTDVSHIPEESYELLRDLDVLVLDALRYTHHPTHMTVEQALAAVQRIKPQQAYFTHIAHEIRHADLQAQLPPGVSLAHDGLLVKV